MILLTQPTDFLELNTGSSLSTDWTCSWVDVSYAAGTFVPGSAEGNVAASMATTIAAAPAANVQRQIKYASVVNRDVSTQTVYLDKNSGAAYSLSGAIPLAPGDSLQYVDSRGFFVLTAAGFEKFIGATGAAGSAGATGPAGQGAPGLDGDPGEDAMHIPGPIGPQGIQGVPGSGGSGTGGSGMIILMDGEAGEDGMTIPGAPGAAGSGGSGSVALPGTLPDLGLWIETDNILGAAGAFITRVQERTPWITGVAAALPASNVVVSSTLLNSLPTLTWPAANSTGNLVMATGMLFNDGCTIFYVLNGSTVAGGQAVLGCASANGNALYLSNSGGGAMVFVKAATAVVGTCSTPWTPGTWFQGNVTYNPTSGAYAFRQARAAVNSGTGATGSGISVPTNQLGSDQSTSLLNVVSIAAIIAYNRVLTSTEISNVENYLHTKWGV